MPLLRLDKLLADSGIASRSELKHIIRSGRVTIDGKAVLTPETKIDPDNAVLAIDGQQLNYSAKKYYMLYKPTGVVTATEDNKQKTVIDLLPTEMRRMGLFPVGRLDKDTSGLLLLTNDGDFAHKVISPKSEICKVYYARVDGIPDDEDVSAFRNGIVLRDGLRCMPAELKITGGDECFVTVMEGKYHQVRRMLASRGKTVLELKRMSVGALTLGTLKPGEFRELTEEDLFSVFDKEYGQIV